jgi:hypothetical protein
MRVAVPVSTAISAIALRNQSRVVHTRPRTNVHGVGRERYVDNTERHGVAICAPNNLVVTEAIHGVRCSSQSKKFPVPCTPLQPLKHVKSSLRTSVVLRRHDRFSDMETTGGFYVCRVIVLVTVHEKHMLHYRPEVPVVDCD